MLTDDREQAGQAESNKGTGSKGLSEVLAQDLYFCGPGLLSDGKSIPARRKNMSEAY